MVKRVCRVCLIEDFSLKDVFYSDDDKLENCYTIVQQTFNIHNLKSTANLICDQCIEQIGNASKLKQLILQSDEDLAEFNNDEHERVSCESDTNSEYENGAPGPTTNKKLRTEIVHKKCVKTYSRQDVKPSETQSTAPGPSTNKKLHTEIVHKNCVKTYSRQDLKPDETQSTDNESPRLNQAQKTSAELGREFTAGTALFTEAKTAAQRMREYRERKKLAKKILLKQQSDQDLDAIVSTSSSQVNQRAGPSTINSIYTELTRKGNSQSQQQIETLDCTREYRERRNDNINIESNNPSGNNEEQSNWCGGLISELIPQNIVRDKIKRLRQAQESRVDRSLSASIVLDDSKSQHEAVLVPCKIRRNSRKDVLSQPNNANVDVTKDVLSGTSSSEALYIEIEPMLTSTYTYQEVDNAIVEIATEDIRSAAPSDQVSGPSEIRTTKKKAKSAEATRRWRGKKKAVSGSSKKQAKTAAQRMREYRKRKKLAKKILLKQQSDQDLDAIVSTSSSQVNQRAGPSTINSILYTELTRKRTSQSQQQIETLDCTREYRERRNDNINIESNNPSGNNEEQSNWCGGLISELIPQNIVRDKIKRLRQAQESRVDRRLSASIVLNDSKSQKRLALSTSQDEAVLVPCKIRKNSRKDVRCPNNADIDVTQDVLSGTYSSKAVYIKIEPNAISESFGASMENDVKDEPSVTVQIKSEPVCKMENVDDVVEDEYETNDLKFELYPNNKDKDNTDSIEDNLDSTEDIIEETKSENLMDDVLDIGEEGYKGTIEPPRILKSGLLVHYMYTSCTPHGGSK